MGGTALCKVARHISEAHYDLLFTHCYNRLMTSPPSGRKRFSHLDRPRHFTTKTEHGDMDLICAIEGLGISGLKGKEEGEITYWVGGKSGSGVDGNGDAMKIGSRAWCEDIVRDLNGSLWLRNGPIIDLAVPVSVIDPTDTSDDFYQVDLILTPPGSFDFHLTLYSYSFLIPVFSSAVRYYSRSLILRERCLALRHTSFPGIAPIDLVLSTELGGPKGVFTYFEVDSNTIRGGVMNNEEQLWEWLVKHDEKEDPTGDGWHPGARTWRRLAKRTSSRKTEGQSSPRIKNRPEAVDRFRVYLATTKWAPEKPSPSKEIDTAFDALSLSTNSDPSLTSSTSTTTTTLTSASTSGSTSISTSTSASSSISTSTTIVSVPPIQDDIDPSSPIPLDENALHALRFWGKEDEFYKILALRTIEAQKLFDSRRKNKIAKEQVLSPV